MLNKGGHTMFYCFYYGDCHSVCVGHIQVNICHFAQIQWSRKPKWTRGGMSGMKKYIGLPKNAVGLNTEKDRKGPKRDRKGTEKDSLVYYLPKRRRKVGDRQENNHQGSIWGK